MTGRTSDRVERAPVATLANSVADFAAPDVAIAERIAARAVDALLAELAAWPKPGLVSHVDSGSHTDMDAALLEASARCLRPYFAELAQAGQHNAPMETLRAIGIRAEAHMLSVTAGVNTHRGAIFGLGLLCAAAGLRDAVQGAKAPLGSIVASRWGQVIERGPIPLFSHGAGALRRYGAGGARTEAASGFPSVYKLALPALREGRRLRPSQPDAQSVQACFALIASVEDTNLLHRGGEAGARYAAVEAEKFLSAGGIATADWRRRAAAVHRKFVARWLSPGGCADLLAMTLFIDSLDNVRTEHD